MHKIHYDNTQGKGKQHSRQPLVSIIILNYNGGETFLRCLNSTMKVDYPACEVIVVDNGSTDGSIKTARRRYDRVKYIENGRNLGFCVGNNIGIEHSQGEYILLLNDDAILDSNSLRELMKEVRKRGDGFYNPKILLLDNPRLLDSVGNNLHYSGVGLARGLGQIDKGQYDRVEEVAYANGTCLLVSKKVTKELGLLDPVFFAYGEDADWCWRGRTSGIRSYCVPSAVVYHRLGASFGRVAKRKFYFVERNRIITLLKNYSHRSLILLLPVFLLAEISTLFYALVGGWFPEKIKTYSDIVKLRDYIKRQREFVQNRRTVIDTEVTNIFRKEIEHPYIRNPMVHVLNGLFGFFTRLIRL